MGAPSAIPQLTLRAVLFLLWLVLGNDWLTRHMGWGIDSPILVAALGTLGAGFGLIETATGQNLKEGAIGQLVRKCLSFPMLVGLYAALLVALAGWSSVTILNDPANTVFEATLKDANNPRAVPESQENKDEPSKPVRFTGVWAGPLGRPYRLEVKGYLPQTFDVFPLSGVSLSPRRDLQVSPSVLLRPPLEALGPMSGGVRVEVWMETVGGKVMLADATVKRQSILIGARQPIPAALFEKWRLDAIARGTTNEPLLAKLLQSWQDPLVVAPQKPLEPGRVLKAVVYNPTQEPLAIAQALLDQERLQDVAMSIVVQ